MTTYQPPGEVAEMLRGIGWTSDALTLDDAEVMEKVFHGTLAGSWASGIVAAVDAEMTEVTGTAFLDADYHIVGVMLADGEIVGEQTENVVTGLDRPDACFALRAFWQGFDRVRPMPLPPVAMFDVLRGLAPDGTRLLPDAVTAAAAVADIPDGAKVFVEVDPAQPEVVYDVWAVAPSDSPGGIGIWRRHDGQWLDDPGWLSALRSDDPPNLLYLPNDSEILPDLLSQVDTATSGKQFDALAASIVVGPEVYTDLLPLIARGTRGGLARESGVGKGGILGSFSRGPVTLLPLTRTTVLASTTGKPSVPSDVEVAGITAAARASLQSTSDVLSQGHRFKVIGLDAERYFAEVVEGKPGGDGSDQSAVDVPMYLYRPAFDADQSVPVDVLVPGPQPASVSLFDPSHDPIKRIKFGLVRQIALTPESPVASGAESARVERLVASAGSEYARSTRSAFTLVAGTAEAASLDGLVAARSNAGHVVILQENDLPQFTALVARGSRGGLARASGVGKGGGAEQLRRYWAEGKGAAKIRWGTGGDWYRCTKHLRKYMGTRAKGYCNLLHKRALGYYPSTHAKMERGGVAGGALAAAGDSWRWQLRDALGQWIDMNARVEWIENGKRRTGYVVGSPQEGIATVQMPTANNRRQIPANRLTVAAPALPSPRKQSRVTHVWMDEPSQTTTLTIPGDQALQRLSDDELRDLYWATRDHPKVPLRKWLRIGRELDRRKISPAPVFPAPSALL